MEIEEKILALLLKSLEQLPTLTELANKIGMSRSGTWKILKRLQAKRLILLKKIGSGKTSTYTINLDWDSPLTEKSLSVILTKEALATERWMNSFLELQDKVEFLIIYGSILTSPKDAQDIDLLGLAQEKSLLEIEKTIQRLQKTQILKIHALFFTKEELKGELKKNKALINAVQKGIILFGQEKFIGFIK